MKSRWKIAFWISITILLLSNLFWLYQIIDNAVGMTYFKDSCTNYQDDMIELKRILDYKDSKKTAIEFLELHRVKYDSFQKADNFIIQLNSFDMIYDKNEQLLKSETHH